MAYEIKTIVDSDDYRKYIEENGMKNNNQSKYDYLDHVNSTPELFNKYYEADRAQREANLSHNLGSNWEDIYDIDEGDYINGYSADNLSDGRIGIHQTTGYDIGMRDYDDYSGVSSSISSSSSYDRLLELQKQMRTDSYNRAKADIDAFAEEAARQAYVNMMQTNQKLPEQAAVLGVGGVSESSLIKVQSDYAGSLADIENTKQQGLNELTSEYEAGLALDVIDATERYIEAEEQRKQDERDLNATLVEIYAKNSPESALSPSLRAAVSEDVSSAASNSNIKSSTQTPSYSLLSDTENGSKRVLAGLI